MNTLRKLPELIDQYSVFIRIVNNKDEVSSWSKWLAVPEPNYVEIMHNGPVQITDIKYLELNPVMMQKPGKRIPEIKTDHSKGLKTALDSSGIKYDKVDSLFRINLSV